MVTCNLCRQNKSVEDMMYPYRYVCKECFEGLVITLDGEKINKEWLY